MRWKAFSGALNASVLIGFRKRFVHGREASVFLVLDNLQIHRSRVVKKWLKENEDMILIFCPPSYSPELSAYELTNADLKQQATKAGPARKEIALTRTVIGALCRIQEQPGRVEKYFGQKDVAYAA